VIHLDIFSDPVCPWCYIGKAHLDRALAQRPDHPFVIAWHPFQLNPDMPREGQDRAGYLEEKFGGRARAAAIYARVEQAAIEAGVEMDLAAMTWMPNTLDAHRLIHWAGLEGRQAAVKTALMRGFFRDGRNIGDPATLIEIAGACGLDERVIARLLASDADRDDIAARDMDARRKGVNAVPTFLIARQYVVQGAQPPEVWCQVIDDLLALPQP